MKNRLNKGQVAVLILMLSVIAVQGVYLVRTSREMKNLKKSSATSAEIQKTVKSSRR